MERSSQQIKPSRSPGTTAFMCIMPLLLLFNAVTRAGAAGCGLVLEGEVLLRRAVLTHLEDRLSFDGLELSLEVFGAFGVG